MIEYHFSKDDYLSNAFYPLLLGFIFASAIVLFVFVKTCVQIHKARSSGSIRTLSSLLKLIGPSVLSIIGVIAFGIGPVWPTFQYSRYLPFESEKDSVALLGQIEGLSPVPGIKFKIGDETYAALNEAQYTGDGPSIVSIDGQKFYIVTAGGLNVGSYVKIIYLPRSHMVLDCIQIE